MKFLKPSFLFIRSVFAWSLLLYVVLVTSHFFAKGNGIVPEIPHLNAADLLIRYNWWTTGIHLAWVSWLIVHGAMLTLWWRWK